MDDTCTEITLTLWGDSAQPSDCWEGNPVVAFKGIKVSTLYDSSALVPT